jgi:hypothetical protein
VKKTGRVVVVHEAPKSCGFGAEIVSLVNEKAFLHLEAPPARVTGFDTPFPYTLENEYLPLAHRILPRSLPRRGTEMAPSNSSCPTSAKASPKARSSAGT